jgi:arginyl-tRNA synthetase
MSNEVLTTNEPAKTAAIGIIAQEQQAAAAAIESALSDLGFSTRVRDLRPVPFDGTWGVASAVCLSLANELVLRDLEQTGKLEGLSKKEAKQLASEGRAAKAQELAEQVAARVGTQPGIARVEAANGYVNIYLDANTVAGRLIGEVLDQRDAYGRGAAKSELVMVEHSQDNTHKAFHIGHVRNTALGISVSRILEAAGYEILDATYIGDIGMHVIKCLWCYEQFHQGKEPADPAKRGRWLGEIYAESDARLNYRKDVIEFLHMLAREDGAFVTGIDRMLKHLWRKNTEGEDIAYLLGRFTHAQEIKEDQFREQDVIVKFWPIIGDQLREEASNERPPIPIEGMPEPTMTPEERLARFTELEPHIDWWLHVPRWQEEIKETFQRWERQDPDFVALWKETREWCLIDFRLIFDELGAKFDYWFYESEQEELGRQMVRELLDKGIAEISDGLPVVKIDEKLGLKEDTYRTLPVLRSDGTTLYSTKDLALTRTKFERYHVDRAIWVVDVRQSLYFDQIFKILELWGFEQSAKSHHLGYEIVALPEGVISSRKGNAPAYGDVRDKVLARAREIIEEKNPDLTAEKREEVARQVALGSLKYTMLARDNNKVVIFDLEEALSFDGHSAPYIQYAHARACRILEHAKTSGDDLLAKVQGLNFGALEPEELGLLQHISNYPNEIQRSAEEYKPLLIASYVYELAKRFNDFYHACPVLQSKEPTRTARLSLVAATRQALANGLNLLAVDAPEEM